MAALGCDCVDRRMGARAGNGRMVRVSPACLPQSGMEVDWADVDKCAWPSTEQPGPFESEVGGMAMTHVGEMRILGRFFQLEGRGRAAFANRTAEALPALRPNHDGICCKRMHQALRMRYLLSPPSLGAVSLRISRPLLSKCTATPAIKWFDARCVPTGGSR